MRFRRHDEQSGFTLAELLIALAILGVIATFTIPKVLISGQNGEYNAKAKEAVAMISEAYIAYQKDNVVDENTGIASLTPYLNYVTYLPNGTQIDGMPGAGPATCTASNQTFPCILLHNGAVLRYRAINGGFGTSGATPQHRVSWFEIDPDGYQNNHPTDGKAINFFLSESGHLRDNANVLPNSSNQNSNYNPDVVPDWFSW
ncbi:MAG TPA: type II secretion system protein [Oculatellaceae cyanobacterium]|jgi:prepilin-type N-terminal cleavage/methylation domain-containing protein